MPGFDRHHALGRLSDEEFDLLVVGGGITGAGVALDAASRGLRTALVEQGDFGSGTSSKSSKLIHGGLRYLEQRELRLVHESLVERQRLLTNAPHLVHTLPFLIPLFGRDGVARRAVARSYATALWLYDVAGGWRIGRRHRRIGAVEAAAHLPTLRTDRLAAGFLYYDARADDARLTLTVLRTAVLDHGAVAANYAACRGLERDRSGRVHGARVVASGNELSLRARVVVNATGVWADEVVPDAPALRPAKGVHVTVPGSLLPCDIACVVPVRADHRSVFVVPWPGADLTYIGTTDTAYDGPLDRPSVTPDDVAYLLHAVNAVTTTELRPEHVTGVWAGLRPLLAEGGAARTADLSPARHAVHTSPDGVVSVTGGKLTTYRRMAQETVDAATEVLAHRGLPGGWPRARTAHLALHGAGAGTGGGRVGDGGGGDSDGGTRRGGGDHLADRYGTEAPAVRALADGHPELFDPVVPGLPYLGVEVVWAARCEMARTLDDVLSRRTRAVLQDARGAASAAGGVARLLAPELGWSDEEAARQVDQFARQTLAELDAAVA